MSKDIRSFFKPQGTKIDNNKDVKVGSRKVHKRVYVIDSDSDEGTTTSQSKRHKSSKRREDAEVTTVKKTPSDLKPVDVADILGSSKVKRSKSKEIPKKKHENSSANVKKNSSFEEIHSDNEFESILPVHQLDEIESAYLNKKAKSDLSSASNLPKKELGKSINNKNVTPTKKESEKKFSTKKSPSDKGLESSKNEEKHTKHYGKQSSVTPSKVLSPTPKAESATVLSPTPKAESATASPSIDPAEKKRQNAMKYMKFLQREGPKNLGSKDLPKGKPGCLLGLTFVISGVLDSLERDQAANLIQQYGGKVTSSISRKTSYLVRGDDPGPSKLEKAIAFGTQQIDEDGLFDLIIKKSNESGGNSLNETSKINNKKHKYKEVNAANNDMPVSKKRKDSSQKGSKESKPSPTATTVSPSKASSYNKTKDEPKKNINYVHNTSSDSMWVDKYRPTSSKQIIGQQGDRSVLRKLTTWLQNWNKNHSGNKKQTKPSPWAKNDDGAYFKAALLSGPPGIGKTTMAHVVSKELGFDVVEFNASDTRSKKLLQVELSELLASKSIYNYFHSAESKQTSAKHVLLMDEVDGMSGNQDRGGMVELIQLIKSSHVPIICMCNDRNHPKIRSLANYCFDLRVMKPRMEQIRGAMMSVCFKEGLKISPEALGEIISGTNQDMRQILHHLSMWSANNKSLSSEEVKKESDKAKKDLKVGPWDVLKKVFSAEDHKKMSIYDKSDLFFHDYSLSPLFVQENYLSVVPIAAKGNIVKTLSCVAEAAESISMGDVIDKKIRSRNAWNLLPVQAMFSSVIPGDAMEGYLRSQINFPSWLGKNSRRNKFDRLLQELYTHMRLSTSGSKEAINLDYLTHIRNAILNPLISDGASGIPTSLRVMQDYHLMREDLESVVELTVWPGEDTNGDPVSQNLMSLVDSKVKAAFTRAYNKGGIMTPYSVGSVVKKRSAASSKDYDEDEEALDEENEADDDISHDAMIKAKKHPPAKARAEPRPSTAKPSQGKRKGKGKSK